MNSSEVLANRTFLGLLQTELAVKLGCSRRTVQSWEVDERNISKEFKAKLESLVKGRNKVDRLMLKVCNIGKVEPELSIQMPTYFKVDTEALYQVLMKELRKQERKAEKS